MTKDDTIKFATLHLEGITHEWWYHGLVTQGHSLIDTYDEFYKILIERFDRKDLEVYFRELVQLKQEEIVNYVEEFPQLSIMVFDVTKED